MNERKHNLDRQTDRRSLVNYPKDYSFNGIDLIKFFCAYLVCMIHIKPIEGIEGEVISYFNYAVQNGLSRIAVPFFFVSSGFFLFRKINSSHIDIGRIKKYCYKMIAFLGLWTVLLFLGDQTQLWYLGGSVIAVMILTRFLYKGYSFIKIGCIAAIIYVIGLLFDSYSGLIKILSAKTGLSFIYEFAELLNNDVTSILRLGLFSGVLFVFIGIIFVYKPIKMKLWISFVGFVLSIAALLAEAFAIKHFMKSFNHNVYICLVPAVFFLFYFASHIKLKKHPIYKTLREISVLIFFTHLFVYKIVHKIIKMFADRMNDSFKITLTSYIFILTVILTTALSIFIQRLSQKEKYKWLKRIYS